MRTIVNYSMNNDVTFCPRWKLKITGKGLRPRSRGLQPPSQSLLILIAMNILGCRVIRRQGLVSYLTANSMVKILQIVTVRSVIPCCAINQEFLTANRILIDLRIASVRDMTSSPSKADWGFPLATDQMPSSIIKNMNTHRKGNYNTSRSRIK